VSKTLADGARVGARDQAGRTPLDLARVNEHEKVIEILRGYSDEAKV
jgi:hypothetical protein